MITEECWPSPTVEVRLHCGYHYTCSSSVCRSPPHGPVETRSRRQAPLRQITHLEPKAMTVYCTLCNPDWSFEYNLPLVNFFPCDLSSCTLVHGLMLFSSVFFQRSFPSLFLFFLLDNTLDKSLPNCWLGNIISSPTFSK